MFNVRTHTICEQNAEFWYTTAGGTSSNYWASNSYTSIEIADGYIELWKKFASTTEHQTRTRMVRSNPTHRLKLVYFQQ
jgi:hypothetical protein